ncbi:MAG: amidohydrolase family protein [Parasphingorhabdus sp.]
MASLLNHRGPEVIKLTSNIRIVAVALVACLLTAGTSAVAADEIIYDIVIENGRAMDPETGLDAIRNIGISGGKIAHISPDALDGKQKIDASDHIVAPGFIDIHSHSPTPLGFSYQARDGVTTSLELEAGSYPLHEYGALIRDKAMINYGASAGSLNARIAVMTDFRQSSLLAPMQRLSDNGQPVSRAFIAPASTPEIAKIKTRITDALDNGAIGIGVPLDYMNVAVKEPELRMLFELGASYSVPLFIHIRRGLAGDPEGLDEVLVLAKETGTRILICHLSHSAMQNTPLFLQKIRRARANGTDVWTEVLPYNAGSVQIGAAVFNRDWRKIFNIDYKDVQLAETGEWFTKESFERTRKENPGAEIIHHYLKEDWTKYLAIAPDVIISSDGLPALTTDKKVPPQGVGSFSKILGTYVREEQALEMMTALSKMTLQPAQLLEKAAPVFRLKGRLQLGMDADITIFDPKTIRANTTYLDPHQASTGVKWLLVDGQIMIDNGTMKSDVYPGQFLKATPSQLNAN